jgi:hypothetical protein
LKKIELIEKQFKNNVPHYENDFKILNEEIIRTNSKEFYSLGINKK